MSNRRVCIVATAAVVIASACASTRASTSEAVHFDTVPATTVAPATTTTHASSTTVASTTTLGAQGPVVLPPFDAVVEQFLRSKGALGASVAIAKGGRLIHAR